MQFHRTLGPTPMSPVKHAGTQLDGGAVESQQAIFESKFLPGTDRLALGQQIVEQLLEQLPRPMGVGIGQGRTFGFPLQPQVLQFALATLQTVSDFAQRTGLSQLAEKHRDKLRPTAKTSGMTLRSEFAHVAREIRTLKERQNLGKQTAGADHLRSPLMMGCGFDFTRILIKDGDLFHPFSNLIWTLVVANRTLFQAAQAAIEDQNLCRHDCQRGAYPDLDSIDCRAGRALPAVPVQLPLGRVQPGGAVALESI